MILKYILLLFFFTISSFAQEFTLASYNVENLFDLKHDRSEYKEYIPNTKSKWNYKSYQAKLKNISKTIIDLDADIILLQEIESQQASNDLFKRLKKYKYSYFYKSKKQAIGLSIFSKYKILKNEILNIKDARFNRAIVKSTVLIFNKKFIVFNNHWPSKRNKESIRVKYALVLYKHIKKIQKDIDYVLIGDFNSNYNENETFLYDKKLNNTSNLTAINDVIYTSYNNTLVNKNSILDYKKRVHYNLWLDLLYKNRFSYIYRGRNSSPDNILLAPSLFDNKNISYINNSFKVFTPNYLIKKRKINRWKMKNKVHQAKGYSDHLPIIARFSSKEYIKDTNKINNIREIYVQNTYNYPINLKNISVIYKSENLVILKKYKDRAIVVYKDINNLKLGFSYDLQLMKIAEFNGLKEVLKLKVIKQYSFNKKYKNLYLDAKNINIFNKKYINEIITNKKALYKNNYFYFKDGKIRVYSRNKSFLPKNGQKVNIINAHLSFYKDKMQITIHKKSDINVN